MSYSCGFVDAGRSLWREDGSVVYNCCWRSYSRDQSPVGHVTIFYTVRFETSLLVVSYDSKNYGAGIRPRLHKRLFHTPYRFLHFCSYLCLHLLMTVFRQPSREHLFEGFVLSVVTKNTPPLCRKYLSIYALSCERVHNCHPDTNAYSALIVAVV
jgi:hypothetical protein